jgi:hypothetical protein
LSRTWIPTKPAMHSNMKPGGSSDRIVVNIIQTYHEMFDCISDVYAAKVIQENSW